MPLVIIIIGASGIIAQVILIRELLVSFQGNEFSIGFIISSWLLAEALGSYLARRIKISVWFYKLLILLFAIFLPILCIGAQVIRPLFGVLPGEIVTFPIMFIASLLILLPAGFLHGALFTATNAYLLPLQISNFTEQKVPGYVYTLENIGTIIGGIIIYFLLIPYLTSLAITLLISLVNILIIIFIKQIKTTHFVLYRNFFLIFCLIILGTSLYFSSKIERWAISRNFSNFQTIYITNTIYGKITVTKHEEQYTFLLDGVPSIITPYPEQTFVEDFAHFPLLIHSQPKKVLLIGGGAGGVLSQILKHPVDQIYYLELDPFLIKTIKKFPTPLTIQELSDKRIKIINTDARFFLERTKEKFDLILVSMLNPLSLQTNRFFTQEFFLTCKNKLNNDGIFVTISPGSLTYLSPLLGNIINVRINTLKSAFSYVTVIPGDFNLYLASSKQLCSNPETLAMRLSQRQITTNLFTYGYIQYRTSDYILEKFKQMLNKAITDKSTINHDGLPKGLFYNLYYANTVINPKLNKLFLVIQKTKLDVILLITVIIFIVLLLFRKKSGLSLYLPLAIFTTGMVAMFFSLVLSLGFQIRYGFLYYQLSILLTTFIAGTAIGGFLSNNYLPAKAKYFSLSELLIIIILIILGFSLENQAYPKIIGTQFDFFILLFISGMVVGLQFPLANKLLKQSQTISIVGKLYACDLLGGSLGAIFIPVCLIAVIGISQTLVWALVIKIISLCLILTGTGFRVE
ncbi:MAG: fused MFS/spermidine synthase [candidate division WOR-3 bacterium]|nr:fused MFS/spermidine synthase [candidate division WOR-3 bacterium]